MRSTISHKPSSDSVTHRITIKHRLNQDNSRIIFKLSSKDLNDPVPQLPSPFILLEDFNCHKGVVGWCDGPVKTSSAGASYNLDDSRARAYYACSRCG